MKKIISQISDASGEQWFNFICLGFLSALLAIAIIAISSNHEVRCYYLKTEVTNAGIAYRVMSDIDWMEDIGAYSSGNPADTLKVISGLRQCGAH